MGEHMQNFVQQIARFGVAVALTASALAAQATLIDNHVLVGPSYGGGGALPGYDQAYSIRLGTGTWPFPYVDLYVDVAAGKNSYASITAGPSYLTYIQSINIVQVKAGDEISARSLTDGSLPSFVKVTAFSSQQPQPDPYFQVQPLTSSTGTAPDIYLGFSYTDTQGLNPAFGWAHLRYTQAAGLSMVSSAMTTSDAGIFALTRNTISSVPEPSTTAMLGLGGILGLAVARRRHRPSRS
jgi:PEP-CTERM motif